jgi:hypothetical protein
MKIKDFLYRLHKPESASKEETTEMHNTVAETPFLAELDINHIHEDKSYKDLSLQLHISAQKEYVSDLNNEDVLYPTHDDSGFQPELPIADSTPRSKSGSNSSDPGISIPSLSIAEQSPPQIKEDEKVIYFVEESDFIKYLNTLPPCTIPSNQDEVELPNIEFAESKVGSKPDIHHETDELIKSSLDLNQGISSESLANLWVKQGRPDLAIQMFEKLAIEYPEKSATFAVKIEKLKTENSL